MSKMPSDKLPNEMYEKIFSNISHGTDLLSCRLVSRRWNSVATKFWRQLPSTRAQVYNENSMSEFLTVMDSCIQEFPFCRIRFNSRINSRNIKAAHTLLMNVAPFIEDVQIVNIYDQNRHKSERSYFVSFIENLDISMMPNLVKLSIDTSFLFFTSPPAICLKKLHTLEVPLSTENMEWLANFLVNSAPNLKLFKTSIEYRDDSDPDPISMVWPFGEECKRIPVIELKLKVRTEEYSESLGRLTFFIRKLNEWKNIHVKKFKPHLKTFYPYPATNTIHNLIKSQINSLMHLDLEMRFFRVPTRIMPNLETLKLTFDRKVDGESEQTFDGNLFPRLQTVILTDYCECERINSKAFRTAAFETVKTLTLGLIVRSWCECDDSNTDNVWKNWNTCFPNLESFTYIITNSKISYFQYVFSQLRMKSLKQVRVQVGTSSSWTQSKLLPFTNILSGFSNFEKVMRGAQEARDQGGKKAQDAYWTKLEASNCKHSFWDNLPALTSLYLDLEMDDDFVSGILTRMKPLQHLSIYSKNLSQETFRKLTNRHGSVELLHQNLKKSSEPEESCRTQ